MPSPGISFGDLMVFIAVVVIVAIFLLAVRAFIKRVETHAETQDRQPEQSREAESRAAESPQFTSSQSASR